MQEIALCLITIRDNANHVVAIYQFCAQQLSTDRGLNPPQNRETCSLVLSDIAYKYRNTPSMYRYIYIYYIFLLLNFILIKTEFNE